MKLRFGFLCCFLIQTGAFGQLNDVAVIHHHSVEETTFELFENEEEFFSLKPNPFKARTIDVNDTHPELNVSGDFDGDGLDEIAVFNDLLYTPNLNPAFTCSVIKVYKSTGDKLRPVHTWFSVLDNTLDFDFVSFSCASDFNGDGLCDIALLYNDPSSEQQQLYVLESDGFAFSEPIPYFITSRNDFNFTAIKFACAGDFNGNGNPDIAVFYNYFGTAENTKQSIFLFESSGSAFTLLPGEAYNGIKQDYDFSKMKFALPGDFNEDGNSDVAVIMEDTIKMELIFPVFEGSLEGKMTPVVYGSIPSSSIGIDRVEHALSGDFSGEGGSDLVLFFDDPVTGGQEVLLLKSESAGFKLPTKHYVASPSLMLFNELTTLVAGNFVYKPMVTATTWKDDMKGAISFTFDDGYRGAFEYGAAELEAAGLNGTFYIFTDTTLAYSSELARKTFVDEYRIKGHEIGSHTRNLSNLGLLTEIEDFDSLTSVLESSVETLNDWFEQETFSLSIPFGSFRYETLGYISQFFRTARSSQHGFNLATPYDFFALKSWPVLSTTPPEYIDNLVVMAEKYGYYLPLMYNDISAAPFKEDSLIYTYSRDLFRETVQGVSERNVWVDTHEQVYKYMKERNALRISHINLDKAGTQPGYFSFETESDLPDSIFNVDLTLKIHLPESWNEDSVTIGVGDLMIRARVLWDNTGDYVLFNCIPGNGTKIQVFQDRLSSTAVMDETAVLGGLNLMAYPNPFSSETQITIEGQVNQRMQLLILDSHGRRIKEIAMTGNNTYQPGLEALSPGLYIVMLLEGGVPASTVKLLKISPGH